jgi:hypothetical protein
VWRGDEIFRVLSLTGLALVKTLVKFCNNTNRMFDSDTYEKQLGAMADRVSAAVGYLCTTASAIVDFRNSALDGLRHIRQSMRKLLWIGRSV